MNRSTVSSRPQTRRQRGVSLIESLIALTVSGLALGAAVPGFGNASERRHLEGATAQLVTDIKLARSEAITHNHTLRMSFSSPAGGAQGSCYVIHTGRAADCHCSAQEAAVCSNGAQALRSASFEPSGALQVRSNVASIVFDPFTGTSSPTGTMRIVGRQGSEVRVIVNIMGRTRTCSPAGVVPGYAHC